MLNKVREYINKHQMLQPGDVVAAGISGGADSLCLLFLLLEMRRSVPFELLAVHVNHGIREDAREDAQYVEKICGSYGVPFFLKEEDVARISEELGISEEEAGRNVRYRAYQEALDRFRTENGFPPGEFRGKIAVAHTSNDRAETMLFHLFRGTGPAGLAGIRPVRENIIRPILCLSRAEVERYLHQKGIRYCIDSTNYEDTYTRNRIRHHIVSYAEQNICGGAVKNMNHTADLIAETEQFMEELTEEAAGKCVRSYDGPNKKIMISAEEFLKMNTVLQKRVLLKCLGELTPARKNITSAHIGGLLLLFYKEGNKRQSLPFGLTAERVFSQVVLEKKKAEYKGMEPQKIKIPSQVKIEELGVLEFTLLEYDKSEIIPEKTYTKWFDYDKIEKSLVLRTRESGDYLTINHGMSRKLLKKYLMEEKIPRDERDRLCLLADGSHILWVIGHRISEFYKVGQDTKYILQVHLRGGH